MGSVLYFPVTENCNLKCGHCYLSAGPGKKDSTVLRGDFEKIVDNLLVQDTRVVLSGGEVTTIPDDLDYFLGVLDDRKKSWRSSWTDLSVEVQTNGTWGTSVGKARDFLLDLERKGVDAVHVSSNSPYHRRAGMKEEFFSYLEMAKSSLDMRVSVPSGFNTKSANIYVPMGRAENLGVPFDDLRIGDGYVPMCYEAISINDDDYVLTVDSLGAVYNCCFKMFALDGNLIEESLERIIDRSLRDKDFSLLNKEGVGVLAQKRGLAKDVVNNVIDKQKGCGLCVRVFGKSGDMKIEDGVCA